MTFEPNCVHLDRGGDVVPLHNRIIVESVTLHEPPTTKLNQTVVRILHNIYLEPIETPGKYLVVIHNVQEFAGNSKKHFPYASLGPEGSPAGLFHTHLH